jgi:hypothetical protein
MPLDFSRVDRGPVATALAPVLQPGARIVVWQRPLPADLAAAAAALLAHAPFVACAEDAPEAALATLATKLPAPLPAALEAELRLLADGFAELTGRAALRIRLEALVGPGCHRWHADAVGLRLLCTYAGPGTEWLDLPGGARLARRIDPAALPVMPKHLRPGEAAVLKGEAFPGNANNGCIHRSPPNAKDAPPRLILCLDEPGRIPLE